MDWREAGFKEGRLLGWDWREEERRAGPVSGKRERVVGERECCREVRESNPLTLFFSVFKIILIKSFLSLAICGKKIMHLTSVCLIC